MPYLTREAVAATLDFIARVPESEVVFDYAVPFDHFPPARRAEVMAIAESAAARGEPWLSQFDPAELSEMLRKKVLDWSKISALPNSPTVSTDP